MTGKIAHTHTRIVIQELVVTCLIISVFGLHPEEFHWFIIPGLGNPYYAQFCNSCSHNTPHKGLDSDVYN